MKSRFLLVTDPRKHSWSQVIQEALAPLGDLDTQGEGKALSLIQQRRYGVVIIDATHTKDAPRLLSRIRRDHQNVKVVFATASPDWREARQAFRLGATDYIYRSMTVMDLRSRFQPFVKLAPHLPVRVKRKEERSVRKATILFADNDRKFFRARKSLLEKAGYKIIGAHTPDEAKRVLNEENLDLAILDMRLVNDGDDKDISGIQVAREAGRYVPKIILTGYPSHSTAVEAMRPFPGLQPAVDYIFKEDGHEKLVEAIERALNLRVFVVHGRDDAAKESVARFIESMGLWAIILHEQAGGGLTIIEKFEANANVGFAIALLTPDDVGGIKGRAKQLKPRARQNVIFELGYFIGKLGRKKVTALYKKGVEIPSDYLGIECFLMDKGGGWKDLLKREIKKSGINLNGSF